MCVCVCVSVCVCICAECKAVCVTWVRHIRKKEKKSVCVCVGWREVGMTGESEIEGERGLGGRASALD